MNISTISSMENLQKTNFSSPFTTTLNTSFLVKLDRDNYLLGRSQVLLVVGSHEIIGYLFDTNTCPPVLLDIQDTYGNLIQSLNPTYEQWNREDQLLLSWLLSSLPTTILGQMIWCTTLHELWTTLEHLYSSCSKAKLLQLKIQLQTLKKGSLSISDYFAKMKNIVD